MGKNWNQMFSRVHKSRNECEHRKIKRNFPYGRRSQPTMKCKICKQPVKPKHFEKIRQQRELNKSRGYR